MRERQQGALGWCWLFIGSRLHPTNRGAGMATPHAATGSSAGLGWTTGAQAGLTRASGSRECNPALLRIRRPAHVHQPHAIRHRSSFTHCTTQLAWCPSYCRNPPLKRRRYDKKAIIRHTGSLTDGRNWNIGLLKEGEVFSYVSQSRAGSHVGAGSAGQSRAPDLAWPAGQPLAS